MPVVNEKTIGQLTEIAEGHFNTLLTGDDGIGKSAITKAIARRLKLKVKYYSCSTMDPYVDFTGIPVPEVKTRTISFCRPKDVMEAEWMIFDEFPRSHKRVQNAVMELIQYRTVNGERFPNLKFIWAIRNPTGGIYDGTDLDPALIDRFHAQITLTGAPSVEYYVSKRIPQPIAQALVDWWNNDLKPENRQMVTPRTLESLGKLMTKGLDWKFCLGDALGVPTLHLETRLKGVTISKYDKIRLFTMLKNLPKYTALAKNNTDFATHAVASALISKSSTCYQAASVLLALPDEFQMRLLSDAQWLKKMERGWAKVPAVDQMDEDVQALRSKVRTVASTS